MCHLFGPSTLCAALVHAHSIYGNDIKYPPGFTHFDYADPHALKGGDITLANLGTFDSLNPFVLKGNPASMMGLVYETLAVGSQDEEYTHYGKVAQFFDVAPDHSSIEFTLNPKARFHDGSFVTPEDIKWAFHTLVTEGHPFYRSYYQAVDKVEITGPHKIKFFFKEKNNKELPLIVGQLPVLSKKFWQGRAFDSELLNIPLGSGPYRIKEMRPGQNVVLERVKDYWGQDLPVNKGMNNFDQITYEYYLDIDVMHEAFLSGSYDFKLENTARNWATGYNIEAVQQGYIIKEMIKHSDPVGLQAMVFNTRRELFRSSKVREALSLLFNFDWTNKNIFYNSYTKSLSYFNNTDLAAPPKPDSNEIDLLRPYLNQLDPHILDQPYTFTLGDGNNDIRALYIKALELLYQEGWVLQKGHLIHQETRQEFRFEILADSKTLDRIFQPMIRNWERVGIFATVRYIDASQYENRLENFDFDMTMNVFSQSLNPSNEQRNFWGSAAADKKGSYNLPGIKSPVIDALIEKVIMARNRAELINTTRALDRVLLWGYYTIPLYYSGTHRLAYWDRFDKPEINPKYGIGFPHLWWIDPEKSSKLKTHIER